MRRWQSCLFLGMVGLMLVEPAIAKPEANSFLKMSAPEKQETQKLSGDYLKLLGSARSCASRYQYVRAMLEKNGFQPLGDSWQTGGRYYLANRDRSILAFVAGQQLPKEGVRLIGAHLDSPCLEIRVRPFKTAEDYLLLKTEPFGSLKRYQWTSLPLALVGQVARPDGSVLDISIGENPQDPVFVLPDLAPHVDKEQRKRTADEIFKGDELNVVAGLLQTEENLTKSFISELKKRYPVQEEDFLSADLALVPAVTPREVGLDRALIGGYGQDDLLCVYPAIQALIETKNPERTAMVYLTNNEEVGSTNTTGVRSRFLVSSLDRILAKSGSAPGMLSTLLERSEALSADVSQAINPNFPGTEDAQTTARLGQGMVLKTSRPGYRGSAPFRARLRKLLDDQKIPWQVYAYKVDGGGGATIGGDLQELNLDVVDVGAPLMSMHATFEVSAKSDLHSLWRFMRAFYSF